MSRTLHLFGTDWGAMMVPIHALQWYRIADTVMLLLIFDMKGFSRAATGKDGAKGNQIPTPSFYNSNPVSNNLLYLGSRWSTEKGRKVYRYGEENGFGCFAPTDIRTSDR